MSDESILGPEDMEEDFESVDTDAALVLIQDTMETFLESATVDAVYGEPVIHEDTMVIPAAEVLSVLGFGAGSGFGSGQGEEEGKTGGGTGAGSGGGGGGRVLSRPVAVIVAGPEGVRVEPVVDVTKIALAGLTAFGFMLAMIMRILSPKKALKEIRGD